MTIKDDFPIFKKEDITYLDSASSTQKPDTVIDEIANFEKESYANVHRGLYKWSALATDRLEVVRKKVSTLINSQTHEEIVFVRGTTEAINLVANTYVKSALTEGDEILILASEHHANIVPWQLISEEKKLNLKIVPITDLGEVDLDVFRDLLSNKTAFVSVAHISNVLGSIFPIKKMIELAHGVGAKVLIDGAQGPSHFKVDVIDLDCDFYCFSSHKMYGPTGVGVLYGKESLLNDMPPYQGGGDMIESVTFEKTTFAKPPYKFEAGTPAISQIIGLGKAIEYIENIGYKKIYDIEEALKNEAEQMFNAISEVRIIGEAKEKIGIFSFVIDDVHPHDAGTIFDEENVAIRAGHHCAQPLMKRFSVPATCRASFGIYNTKEDIKALEKAIKSAIKVFK